jgi:hypothetical protein
VAKTEPLENTFTAGRIDITLTEETPRENKMIPGADIANDPKVTVVANSEDCWLFVKIVKSTEFDIFMEFAVADGWTPLDATSDVYYRQVALSDADRVFGVLKGDKVTVKSSVTMQQVNAITEIPRLTFIAFAVQSVGFDTPLDAWSEATRLS